MKKEHIGYEPLTFKQEMQICYIIGEWYIKWKTNLIDWEQQTHRLGYAKEDLKNMICNGMGLGEEDREKEADALIEKLLKIAKDKVDAGEFDNAQTNC